MFTEQAYALVKNLERSSQIIPMFDVDDGVRKVIAEIRALYDINCEQAANFSSGDRSIYPLLNYRHAALQRNKRCLLSYLYQRSQRIKRVRWEFGPIIPADMKTSLCEPEINFFNTYSNSLARYMRTIGDGDGVDLTSHLKPPKSLYIEVRCLEDYGKFELEDGEIILLKKNSQHYLPRSEVEGLVRQGVLQHIE